MGAEDFDERELRIAPVMTGGTSLAIWMGGATAELYRLLRSRVEPPRADAGSRIYRGLLEATRTTAKIDVLTGTSAGGLNNTLLGAAWVLGLPVDVYLSTRATWMQLADLETLLRSPQESNPPSLARGDDYFAKELEKVLRDWADKGDATTDDARTLDMVTTVTTIAAEPRSRIDDFGETLAEVSHAQQLRFRNVDFVRRPHPDSDAADALPDWPEKLAIAARTSASIPGLFEPSYLPVGSGDAARSGRPDFGPNASFRHSRWAVDGGTVVNLPLGEALDRIYEQTADGPVRRVVLYISPTPSTPAAPAAEKADGRPTIRDSLLSIVTSPRAEGISDDVDGLERRNRMVAEQSEARRTISPLVDAILGQIRGTPPPAAAPLFALYRTRRADASVQDTAARLREAVGPIPLDPSTLNDRIAKARIQWLPERLDQLEGPTTSWGWGIAPVEQAVSIALGLISRTQGLVDAHTSDELTDQLKAAKKDVHGAREVVARIRRLDEDYWDERFREVPGLNPSTSRMGRRPPDLDDLKAWAENAYAEWPNPDDEAVRRAAFRDLETAHLDVATAIRRAHDAIVAICTAAVATMAADLDGAGGESREDRPAEAIPETGAPRRVREGRTADAVLAETDGLFAAGDDPRMVQRQLLRIHVAQTLMLGKIHNREQRIELMQLSWNSWNGLDPDRSRDDKLAGPELNRLGAFLKKSWRANDWTWGRMDAAHRLVVLLLDPTRLAQLYEDSSSAQQALRDATGVVLPPEAVAELSFLDDPETEPVPTQLRLVAETLAREIQLEIARDELPKISATILADKDKSANTTTSAAWAEEVGRHVARGELADDETVAELVRHMSIGVESIGDELGYSRFNRVVSKGAAVSVNALTGSESGVPYVAKLLRPLRVPLHAVNSLVTVMSGPSDFARGATALILGIAGAIVALRIVGVGDIPGWAFAIAGIVFAGAVVVAMLRSGFVRIGLVTAGVAIVIGLVLLGEDLAPLVYSTEDDVAASTLEAGTRIDVGDAAILRVTRGEGDDQLVEDLEAGGATVELRNDSADVLASPGTDDVADWKRWGFVNPVSIGRVVLVAAVIGLLYAASQESTKKTTNNKKAEPGKVAQPARAPEPGMEAEPDRVPPAVAHPAATVDGGEDDRAEADEDVPPSKHGGFRVTMLVVGAAVCAGVALALPTLAEDALTGAPTDERSVKSVLVDIAEGLADHGLVVTLVLLVSVGVAIALGADLFLSRRPTKVQKAPRS